MQRPAATGTVRTASGSLWFPGCTPECSEVAVYSETRTVALFCFRPLPPSEPLYPECCGDEAAAITLRRIATLCQLTIH